MHVAVREQHGAAPVDVRPAGQVGEAAARLGHDGARGGEVPRAAPGLHAGVDPAVGHEQRTVLVGRDVGGPRGPEPLRQPPGAPAGTVHTPTTTSPSTSRPIWVAHPRAPATNRTVPSIPSTIHRR